MKFGSIDIETKVLVQAVKRNLRRFAPDFMFQLTQEEFGFLRSQFVTSKGREVAGGRRHMRLQNMVSYGGECSK
jgi:hypothetical protein